MSIFEKFRAKEEQTKVEQERKVEDDTNMLDIDMAWEKDEKLIELAAKYSEAKARAEEKGNLLKRKIGEMLLSEKNRASHDDLSSGNVDEIILSVDDEAESRGNSEKNIYKRHLLRKAAKSDWTNDQEYKQAAINYLKYITPYMNQLDKEVISTTNELMRLRHMHKVEEMKLTSKLSLVRIRIESFLRLHGLNAAYSSDSTWNAEYLHDIAKSKNIVETAIKKLEYSPEPVKQELMNQNDKILAETFNNGGSIAAIVGQKQ